MENKEITNINDAINIIKAVSKSLPEGEKKGYLNTALYKLKSSSLELKRQSKKIEENKDTFTYIINRASGLNQSSEFTFEKFYWEVVKKIRSYGE